MMDTNSVLREYFSALAFIGPSAPIEAHWTLTLMLQSKIAGLMANRAVGGPWQVGYEIHYIMEGLVAERLVEAYKFPVMYPAQNPPYTLISRIHMMCRWQAIEFAVLSPIERDRLYDAATRMPTPEELEVFRETFSPKF